MSKFSKSLQNLTADQLVEKVDAYAEQLQTNLTDPKRGMLRTAFNALSLAAFSHGFALVKAAAEKNGVEGKGHDGMLAAIAEAARKRGSTAGGKTAAYVEFLDKLKEEEVKQGIDKMNGFTGVKKRIQLAKQVGAKP